MKKFIVKKVEVSERNGGLFLHGENISCLDSAIDREFHWHINFDHSNVSDYDFTTAEMSPGAANVLSRHVNKINGRK